MLSTAIQRLLGADDVKDAHPPATLAADGHVDGEAMYLGFRAYLEPETMVGPAWQEMVFDRAILCTRKRH